jgi:hypothetical protein
VYISSVVDTSSSHILVAYACLDYIVGRLWVNFVINSVTNVVRV